MSYLSCFAFLVFTFICGLGCASDTAVLVVDKEYESDSEFTEQLEEYKRLVQLSFDYELLITFQDISITPDQMRKHLQDLRSTKGINGAYLIGRFRYAVFYNECTDVSTLYSYYSDLDGEFRDSNGDGRFDFYNPWPSDDVAPVHEIWLAILRPYYTSATDHRTVADITDHFAEVNQHLATLRESETNQAAIFTSRIWPYLPELERALKKKYQGRVEQRGGVARQRAIATSTTDFKELISQPSELCFVYAHSDPSCHYFDLPSPPSNSVEAGVATVANRVCLEDFAVKARILSLWGCHALDVEGVKHPKKRFLADSYVFMPNSDVQTILGASRGIGMEQMDLFVDYLDQRCICDAWLMYLNACYDKRYLQPWLEIRNAWEKEQYGFDWGYVIYGNPFDKIGVE
jgi:hypothetical protein